MRKRRDPVPRARDAWVWLGGLALLGVLGAGVTAAAVVLWENIDIRQLVPQLSAAPPTLPTPVDPPEPAMDRVDFDAVLFNSTRNQAYFPDAAYYRDALGGWRDLIGSVGGRVRDAASATQLEAVEPGEVLVVVEAPCLSPEEAGAIEAHLTRGGSVVSNWATGARDGNCEWIGWDVVMDLTGAEDVRELPPREGLFLTVPASVSLSPGFDPGTRIELRPDPSLALRLGGPRVYWSDWALNPQPDESGGGADVAATATHTEWGGRSTWFGLRLGQGATSADSLRLQRLVRNGVMWAAGTSSATPAAWPNAERAALLFTLDVEDQARTALGVAALLREEGIRGTFFAVSQIVETDAALAEALLAAGEVGSQTSDHSPLRGLTVQDQRFRLRRAWNEIEGWTGVGPRGLRPPEETFDATTLDAWRRAGGDYLLASNEARSASPELHGRGDDAVVVLPRLMKDDYNLIVQDRVLRATSLAAAFVEGTRKLHAIGGLAVVAGHTQIMRTPARLEALRTVADSVRAQGGWWIAEAGDVAAWWRARSGVRLAFVGPDPSSEPTQGVEHTHVSDVVVSAPPDRGIEGLWVDLVVPTWTEDMVPLVDGRSVDFVATPWGVRVPVSVVGAGESRRISVVVVEADGEPGA